MEEPKITINVELMSTHDRCAATILIRSNDKITVQTLVLTLENFTKELRDRFKTSKIDVQSPKLIVPT